MPQKTKGCFAALLFLVIILFVACLPSVPLWLTGHGLAGGLVFAFFGLPLGFVLAILLLIVAAKADNHERDKKNDKAKTRRNGD